MTTSGITSYSRTARDIITDALTDNGIVGVGEEPEAAEMTACMSRLNNMLKSWQSRGVLWKQETITVTGTALTAAITLPDYVRGVNGARYIDSAVNARQMTRWERDEYMSLPNKIAYGTPSVYYVDRNASDIVLYVWQVPRIGFTLSLDIDRAMDTVTNVTQTVDVPDELLETVMMNLALRCCGIFQANPSPLLAMRAPQLETELFDNWRPASYYLGPY